MAGYSGTPLWKKIGLKEDFVVRLVAAPRSVQATLAEAPFDVNFVTNSLGSFHLAVIFAKAFDPLNQAFCQALDDLTAEGVIWCAWPKKASGVATELDFSRVQHLGLDAGLVDVKNCAIDEVWSGLKFVVRKAERKTWPKARLH